MRHTTNDATYKNDDDDDHQNDVHDRNVQQRTLVISRAARGAEGDEVADEYFEDDDDQRSANKRVLKSEELANLSRQSMVPIHELIAYYSYIQNGDQQHSVDRTTASSSSATTSRQSSSASQATAQTRHSDDDSAAGGADEFEATSTRLIRVKRSASQTSGVAEDSEDDDDDDNDRDGYQINQDSSMSDKSGCDGQLGPRITVDSVDQSDLENQSGLLDNKAVLESRGTAVASPRLRANVILELINSERDFVKHLKDVVEGYLQRARKRPEIFTAQRVSTIFANIEQLYRFQRRFLQDLELCINWQDLTGSEVGQCFLRHEKDFSVYQYYCNNHPNATSELQDLYTKPIFRAFFEECRLAQNMIDISLDGFLLTPIQKICKYPLQLTELLKNTDESHPDYEPVSNALRSMRNCANSANERKRRIEALADVMSFQEKVDNWFGPKLSDTSSILIHSGEVSKMTSHTWSQGVQLFLFDHLLLYSKRDILKRNNLILKGRICMDTITEIADADEYKPRKSFKLYCGEQQKWFVFTTKSEREKDDWIRAFERERNLVEADENEGFHITDRELGIARRTLQHRNRSRSARYRHKRPDTAIVDQLEADDPNTMINRTLSLPSCIHPSHVMNFVEESRVVSTNATSGRAKKNSSPISSSRSPVVSSQQLAEHPDNQSGPTNWLRKMGSKKLSKSQVYNINGQTGQSQLASSGAQQRVQPAAYNTDSAASKSAGSGLAGSANVSSTSGTSSDVVAIKYEELEKRYRDHMFCEEQARLYRLNNDLPPPPTLYPRSVTPTHLNQQHTYTAANNHSGTTNNPSAPRGPPPHKQQQQQQQSRNRPLSPHLVPSNHMLPAANDGGMQQRQQQQQPVSIGQSGAGRRDDLAKFSSLNLTDAAGQAGQTTSSTFETELVLSSGRIVRVREDAV